MKKKMLWNIFLILLPVAAMGLATTVNSVTLYNTVTQETTYQSYLDLGPVGSLQMAPVLAVFLCLVSAVLAAIFAVKEKKGVLKAVKYVALGASIAAVLPIYIQSEVRMIPSVLLPILMMLQWGMAAYMGRKKPEDKEANFGNGRRLERR